MVSTRNNLITPVPTIESMQESINDLKTAIAKIKEGMNTFFIDEIKERDKIQLALMHVYDKALIWHQQFCKRFGEEYPWELYAKETVRRFDSVFDDPLMELKNLKQDGMFTLDTLNDVYYMAKMQEQTIVAMRSRYGHVLTTPKPVSDMFNKHVVGYQKTSGTNVVMPNTSSRNGVVPFRKSVTPVI
ncbi:hypothetical protein Tco_0467999 [Tanacetum coccineum]